MMDGMDGDEDRDGARAQHYRAIAIDYENRYRRLESDRETTKWVAGWAGSAIIILGIVAAMVIDNIYEPKQTALEICASRLNPGEFCYEVMRRGDPKPEAKDEAKP